MKIEIWGTYPPPIGGVTIHILRLIHRLHECDKAILLRNFGEHDPKISYIKTVTNRSFEFVKLLFVKKKIIHLHSNNYIVFLLLLLLGRKHKIGVTLHNKNLIKEKSKVKRDIIRAFLQEATFIILNDPAYKQEILDSFGLRKDRIHVLPAFIPPLECEYRGLDSDIVEFRQKHSFLLSANAYKLRLENGIDVYGFDLLIRLVKALVDRKIDVGLIFCLPCIGDEEYYKYCLEWIIQLGIEDNILVVQRELSNGFEVWKLSDLFVRPTYTDIEGISVKEALSGGTAALVSDVCKRPKEAMLFEKQNFDDLLLKTINYYEASNGVYSQVVSVEENPVNEILAIYNMIDE